MSYSFDLLGIAPMLEFFQYQQENEQDPQRPKAYLASYECTLDGFIQATETIHCKPQWNWDAVIESMIRFWIKQEEKIRYYQQSLTLNTGESQLVIARVANINILRREFEDLFAE